MGWEGGERGSRRVRLRKVATEEEEEAGRELVWVGGSGRRHGRKESSGRRREREDRVMVEPEAGGAVGTFRGISL